MVCVRFISGAVFFQASVAPPHASNESFAQPNKLRSKCTTQITIVELYGRVHFTSVYFSFQTLPSLVIMYVPTHVGSLMARESEQIASRHMRSPLVFERKSARYGIRINDMIS